MADKVTVTDVSAMKNNDFATENDLEQFIVTNIESFTEEILEDKLISFETEKPIGTRIQKLGSAYIRKGTRRIDLYIIGKNRNYIIELKNPAFMSDNRAAIGQLLDYGRELTDSKKKTDLILLSTAYDINTAKTIKFYDLPIRYIYFSKNNSMERCDGETL